MCHTKDFWLLLLLLLLQKERGFRFRVSLSERLKKKILSFSQVFHTEKKTHTKDTQKKRKEDPRHDGSTQNHTHFYALTTRERLSFFLFLRPGPRPERFVVIHHHGGVAGGGGGSGTGTSGGACSRPPILVQSRLHVRLGPGERARRRDELVRIPFFLCASSSSEDDDDERRKVVSRGRRRRRRRRRFDDGHFDIRSRRERGEESLSFFLSFFLSFLFGKSSSSSSVYCFFLSLFLSVCCW